MIRRLTVLLGPAVEVTLLSGDCPSSPAAA
jgi:hypothetical protein